MLFQKIESKQSGINFANTITESDSFNVLDYEYIYNGSGVGIGDFNADGLPDLFFAGNMVSSELYINQGNFKFKHVTENAGVQTDAWCTGVAVVDINNDGLDDIHVATAHDSELEEATNYFFINRSTKGGEVRFENLALEMGLSADTYSMQAAFLDYDKDGDLDLFLINNSMESYPRNSPIGQRTDGSGKSTDRLYRNEGIADNGLPQFTDVSVEANVQTEGWSLGVVVLDVNEDSYPDLYIANDFLSNDLLYINQQDGTFRNEITKHFKHQSHNSMGIDAADVNNDGKEDLLVLDMLPEDNLRHKTMFAEIPFERFNRSLARDYQPQYIRNVFQVNNGDGTFSDWGYFAGLAATDWSWSPLLADFDDDGKRDAYITNGYKKDVTDLDFINYSSGSSVFGTPEARRAKIIEQLNEMKGIKKTNRFFVNQGELRFEEATEIAGLAYPSYSNGAVYADLDQDGDLDLVTNNLNEAAFLFQNNSTNSYLNIKLPNDATAYGSQVTIYSKLGTQSATFYPQRGYLSSVQPMLHFGLDSLSQIEAIQVVFPNGKMYRQSNVATNQTLQIHPNQATETPSTPIENKKIAYLQEVNNPPITFQPQESNFDDFKKWGLHFRSYSRTGTTLAVGDMNGDGLDDVFFGGSNKQSPQLHIQTSAGDFEIKNLPVQNDGQFEDVAATLFDADGDGDLDLYCVRGSSEYYAQPERYQDGFFENDGTGNFTERRNYLPPIQSAGSCVVPIDYDKDGDLDLFVGGRVDAKNYPAAPRSYLLRNDGDRFVDATPKSLARIGLVTDASATDVDKDGWEDLVIVGEWMPISIAYNQDGNFDTIFSITNSNGWWNCIEAADLDGDGDQDFVIGNWGLNNPFQASKEQPLSIYAKDYDGNGATEPIMTYYNQEKEHIFHPRETLAKQLPSLKNIFQDYRSYGVAAASVTVEASGQDNLQVYRAYELASAYLENKGNNEFELHPLPYQVQAAPIFDWEIMDLNQDGHLDLLGVGNFEGTEILSGWYDALNGVTLLGDGEGRFEYISPQQSGFYVPNEGQVIEQVAMKKADIQLLIGHRQDSMKVFQLKRIVW
jgi:hypothetical protein